MPAVVYQLASTINPRISPLRAYFFWIFLDRGLLEEEFYMRGSYRIIVDIKNTLLIDLVYSSRNFFMGI